MTSDYSLREYASSNISLTCSNRFEQRSEFELEINLYQLSQISNTIEIKNFDVHDTAYFNPFYIKFSIT